MNIRLECRAISRQLWEYAAGELTPPELGRVDRHLERCPRCAEELARYRTTLSAVTAARSAPTPESQTTWPALRARLEAERLAAPAFQPRNRARQVFGFAGTAAAGAALALVWFSLQPPSPAGFEPAGPLSSKGPLTQGETALKVPTGPAPGAQVVTASTARLSAPDSQPDLSRYEFPAATPVRAELEPALARRNQRARFLEPAASFAENRAGLAEQPAPSREYVMGSIDTFRSNRHFVMGSIPSGGAEFQNVSDNRGSEGAPVW